MVAVRWAVVVAVAVVVVMAGTECDAMMDYDDGITAPHLTGNRSVQRHDAVVTVA